MEAEVEIQPHSPWPTILVSGGHITPALATIEYWQKHYPEVRIVFVGREFSQDKERQPAKERQLARELGISFYAVTAAKFHRHQWWRNWEEATRWLPALMQAYKIIRQEKIDLFLSFGGYLAVPFALIAKLLGKKIVTHEQTKTSGLANELIAMFADKIAISHEESRRHFPAKKVVMTGNPIRPRLLRQYTRPPSWVPPTTRPILYITGGSQGSQTINMVVSQILADITDKFLVIHQCGQSEHQAYWHMLNTAAENLPESQRKYYVVREWMEETEVSWVIQHAAIALGRSGANTTLELSLHAVPAIYIPLPFAHNQEQSKNAAAMVEAGAAVVLDQKDLSPHTLLASLRTVSAQRAHMRRRAEKLRATIRTDGAKNLAELCLSLLRH